MRYHVIKKRLSNIVRHKVNSPNGGWNCHPMARAYADLQMALGSDENVLEIKALFGLIHNAYRHRTSYEIDMDAGRDGADQIERNLEKIFEFENAPYAIEDGSIRQISTRPSSSSISVGDLVYVEAPKPMVFICAGVGYVRLSEQFVLAFQDLVSMIIIGDADNQVVVNDSFETA